MKQIASRDNIKYVLDTNILVYAFEKSDEKLSNTAIKLINPEAFISNYVFQEFLFQLKKIIGDKKMVMSTAIALLDTLKLTDVNKDTYRYANYLLKKYDFQFSDAIIVSDALLNKCDVLYTRDMQDRQLIEKKLRIVNPFNL